MLVSKPTSGLLLRAMIVFVPSRKNCVSRARPFFRRRRIDLDHVDVGQIDMKFLESISRTPRSAAPMHVRWRRFLDDRDELLLFASHAKFT